MREATTGSGYSRGLRAPPPLSHRPGRATEGGAARRCGRATPGPSASTLGRATTRRLSAETRGLRPQRSAITNLSKTRPSAQVTSSSREDGPQRNAPAIRSAETFRVTAPWWSARKRLHDGRGQRAQPQEVGCLIEPRASRSDRHVNDAVLALRALVAVVVAGQVHHVLVEALGEVVEDPPDPLFPVVSAGGVGRTMSGGDDESNASVLLGGLEQRSDLGRPVAPALR